MSAINRRRRSTAAATALVAALTAGGVLLLTACDPNGANGSDGTAGTAAPTATAQPGGAATGKPGASPAPTRTLNGTANSRLTISTGTNKVVMNGTVVDFGTVVRDLSWSPDGRKAAFIDGSGNLVVSNPDGTGKVTVARNPGGQTWSHPAWQVTGEDKVNHVEPHNNIFFAVAQGGETRLKGVSATAVNGVPEVLGLGTEPDVPPLPQTGNAWPNTGGDHGSAVYANASTGSVYIRDDYLRQQGGKIAEGSQPALAPNAEEVVFVRSVAGHDHIFTERLDGSQAKDLTPKATTDYTEPVWSPDGRTLAVRTPEGIATLPADGSKAPVLVSTYAGLPAYRAGS
ncbi:hypothetical protein [Kitasatospora sp. NPDC059571]|uniref:TolB family protein n=1 Tax=Kitasatospora sp. NPDC059571 TaxID=3346871 RepID=UPI0036889780